MRDSDKEFSDWDDNQTTTDAHTFIQWNGTNACLDFSCPCGAYFHFDTYMLFAVECAHCGAKYRLSNHVKVLKVDDLGSITPKIGESDRWSVEWS